MRRNTDIIKTLKEFLADLIWMYQRKGEHGRFCGLGMIF